MFDNLSDFSARGTPKQNCVQKTKNYFNGSRKPPEHQIFMNGDTLLAVKRGHEIFSGTDEPLFLLAAVQDVWRETKKRNCFNMCV